MLRVQRPHPTLRSPRPPSYFQRSTGLSCAQRCAPRCSASSVDLQRQAPPAGGASKNNGAAAGPCMGAVKPSTHTPSKIGELSRVLRLPARDLEPLLEKHPRLLQVDAAAAAAKQVQLAAALQLPVEQVVFMFGRQPMYFLQEEMPGVLQRVEALAAQLGVSAALVVQCAAATPSILGRQPHVIAPKVLAVSALYGCSASAALRLAAAAPQYLTDSPSSVAARFGALCSILRLPPRMAGRMLQLQPDLVFMSPRIMNNKLRVLMAILDQQNRHVGTLVYKCPRLLRTDLDSVRRTYEQLSLLLGRSTGFVYAMVCHDPRILLQPLDASAAKLERLHRSLERSPQWRAQWGSFKPPQVCDILSRTIVTYDRLDYLLGVQQQDSMALLDALLKAKGDFTRANPGFARCAPAGNGARGRVAQAELQRRQQQQQQQQQHATDGHRLVPQRSATAAPGGIKQQLQHAAVNGAASRPGLRHDGGGGNGHSGNGQHALNGAGPPGHAWTLQHSGAATGPASHSSSLDDSSGSQAMDGNGNGNGNGRNGLSGPHHMHLRGEAAFASSADGTEAEIAAAPSPVPAAEPVLALPKREPAMLPKR